MNGNKLKPRGLRVIRLDFLPYFVPSEKQTNRQANPMLVFGEREPRSEFGEGGGLERKKSGNDTGLQTDKCGYPLILKATSEKRMVCEGAGTTSRHSGSHHDTSPWSETPLTCSRTNAAITVIGGRYLYPINSFFFFGKGGANVRARERNVSREDPFVIDAKLPPLPPTFY